MYNLTLQELHYYRFRVYTYLLYEKNRSNSSIGGGNYYIDVRDVLVGKRVDDDRARSFA